MEEYYKSIKSTLVNLIDCKEHLEEKILENQLEICLNRLPSKRGLIEKRNSK
jgi:hypothetical protein